MEYLWSSYGVPSGERRDMVGRWSGEGRDNVGVSRPKIATLSRPKIATQVN